MRQIALITLLVCMNGCSTNQESSMQNRDIEYQRFLSEKNLKQLKQELENHNEK